MPAAGRPRLGLLLRLACRMAGQAQMRSALIVLLIAIPTFGLAGVATVVTSMIPSTAESLQAELGSSQAHLIVVTPPDPSLLQSPNSPSYYQFDTDDDGPTKHTDGDPLISPHTYLPAARLLTLRPTTATARTAGGIGSFDVLQGDAWNPAFAGRFARVDGATPTSDREAMVSPALLARLDAQVGSAVTLTQPKALRLTIVGTLRDATLPAMAEQLYTRARVIDTVDPRTSPAGTDYYLTGPPVSWQQVQHLNRRGAVVLSRAVALDPPANSALPIETPSVPSQVLIAIPLVGFALLEVVLLAGAAFMVGARRDERTLAMLGCIGANRTALFGVVLATGVVLGVVGGIIGTAAGAAAAGVYIHLTGDGSTTQYPGYHVVLPVLAGIVAFGTLAGLIAAVLPARAASRTDVLAALRGSGRPAPTTRRRPIVGVIALVLGGAVTLVGAGLVIAVPPTSASASASSNFSGPSGGQLIGAGLAFLGPALMQLGVLLLSRLLLGRIAVIAGGIGVGARLGTQDTARNTSRSVPAVAVIMTTLFIGSLIMTLTTSFQAQTRATWQYETPVNVAEMSLRYLYTSDLAHKDQKASQLNQALAASFDTSSVHRIGTTALYDGTQIDSTLFPTPVLQDRPRCMVKNTATQGTLAATSETCPDRYPYQMRQQIYTGTAGDLAAMIGEPLTRQSIATLQAGGAVALYPQYVRNGTVTIQWHSGKQLTAASTSDRRLAAPTRQLELPATVQIPAHDYSYGVFMLDRTATSHGLTTSQQLTVAPLRTAPTERQYDQANAAAVAITGGSQQDGALIFIRVEQGPPDTGAATAWGLLALCALIALAAAAIAIGLSRTEGRRDQWVLTALGASPVLRRSYAFWQTLSITATGAILGVALGITPVLAIALQPGTAAIPFVAPWPQLFAAALGLPLLTAVVTSTTTRPPRQHKAPLA